MEVQNHQTLKDPSIDLVYQPNDLNENGILGGTASPTLTKGLVESPQTGTYFKC